MRFLKVVNSRSHCAHLFIPEQMKYNFQKDDNLFGKFRKPKSNASKAWESLKSKSTSRPPKPAVPSSKPTVCAPSVFRYVSI